MGNRITIQFVSNNYDTQGNVQSTAKSGVLYSHWDGHGISEDVYEFLKSARRDGMLGQHTHNLKDRHEDDPDYGKWYARNKPFVLGEVKSKDRDGKEVSEMVWQCPICKCAQENCLNGEWVNDKHMMPLDRIEPDNVMFNFIVYLGMKYGKSVVQTHHDHKFLAMEQFPYMSSNYRVEAGDGGGSWEDNGHKDIDLEYYLRHIENEILTEESK